MLKQEMATLDKKDAAIKKTKQAGGSMFKDQLKESIFDEDIEEIGKKFDREDNSGEENSPESETPDNVPSEPTGDEDLGETMDKLESFLNPNNLINTISVISTNASINATGKGVGFRIEDGIIYHKGYFQIVSDHLIIARNYDQNTGNTVIGFETTEDIINENIDETLNDYALGYPNYNSPGAHRLKLTPGAIARERTEIANNDTFFAVYEFSNISNELVQNKQNDPYNTIGTEIKRPIMIRVQLPLAAPAIARALSNPIAASAITIVLIAPDNVVACLIS